MIHLDVVEIAVGVDRRFAQHAASAPVVDVVGASVLDVVDASVLDMVGASVVHVAGAGCL